jgi:hypothetical protein
MSPASGGETGGSARSAGEIAEQLSAVADYVRQCELRARRGEIMELGGLDRTVMMLCADIAGLPKAESRALEAQMQQLVVNLDELAAAMRAQQQEEAPAKGDDNG